MNKVLLAGLLSVLAVLFVMEIVLFSADQDGKIFFPRLFVAKIDPAELKCRLDNINAAYHRDCDQYLADFLKDLDREVSPDFAYAERSVSGVIRKISDFRAWIRLCCKLAKDQFKKTNDFNNFCIGILNDPIIQPCLHANAVASGRLQMLEQSLQERSLVYAREIAAVCRKADSNLQLPKTDLKNLQQCLKGVISDSRQLNVQKTVVAVAGSFELIFIRQTCATLMKLFSKPAFKICRSLGIAGVCTVSDGQLPIGDIVSGGIVIGGLLWTVWDIYDVSCVLPEKLHSELLQGIRQTRQKLLEESRKQAEHLVNTYHLSGNVLHKQLKEQL